MTVIMVLLVILLSPGTHYLYITGVPKGTPKNSNALNVFKLLNAQYMTYFEDSEIGYLIQITQIWKK